MESSSCGHIWARSVFRTGHEHAPRSGRCRETRSEKDEGSRVNRRSTRQKKVYALGRRIARTFCRLILCNAVHTTERLGVRLKVTGPERTLVDCLATPRYAGGLEEVFQSASGIPSLDLDRLWEYLTPFSRVSAASQGRYSAQPVLLRGCPPPLRGS